MFLVIPTGVDYRTDRMPMVTFALMALNTLVYIVTFLISLGVPGPEGISPGELWVYENLWLIPALGKVHTYLTCVFVHGGLFHLLGNMVYLFLFGSCVEDALGRWQYVVFYLLGAMGANLCYIMFVTGHFASEIPMGGASGAISACMGGFACHYLKTRINFRYLILFFFRLFTGDFWLPAWLVMSFYFIKDLVFGILDMMGESTGGGVAFGAHVGGFVSGLVMMLLWRAFIHKPEEDGEKHGFSPAVAAALPQGDIYVWENDRQLGPYHQDTLQEMIRLKVLNKQALYWVEGMDDWRPVVELKQK